LIYSPSAADTVVFASFGSTWPRPDYAAVTMEALAARRKIWTSRNQGSSSWLFRRSLEGVVGRSRIAEVISFRSDHILDELRVSSGIPLLQVDFSLFKSLSAKSYLLQFDGHPRATVSPGVPLRSDLSYSRVAEQLGDPVVVKAERTFNLHDAVIAPTC
jgi:hypothetical protein